MWLSRICDEVATLALRMPPGSAHAIAHTHPLQLAANCYSKVHRRFRDNYSYFKSCKSVRPTAMAQSKSLSSDPEELLQFMDNLDIGFSDDDFEGYIDEDEWLEETMSRRISMQQKDGSRNSVVSVHSSRLDGDVNDGTEGSENGDGMEGSENGDGMEGSENGDGMEGSENGDGTDGSENDDGTEGSENGDGTEGSENGDGTEGSENGDGTEGSENGDGMEGSENGDGTDGSENGDGTEGSENGDGTDGSKNDRMDSDGENSDSDDHANTNTNGIPVFAENVGVIPDMTGKEPVDYYRLFITDSLLQNVLDETNRYGEQYVQSHQDYVTSHPRARSHDFVKRRFTMSELLRLIVLMITMGIVDLPSLKDYWSTSWPFCTPHFSKLLSRDRFFLFLKFLYLADNTKQAARGEPGYDKLFKLRPFMDPLIQSFQQMFIPQQQLSIDEAMISFEGRLSFLQYLPKKPKKWGVKAWALADSKMGYVWNWKLHTGKEDEAGSEPLGERVVTGLLTGLEHKGYRVF